MRRRICDQCGATHTAQGWISVIGPTIRTDDGDLCSWSCLEKWAADKAVETNR